MFVVLSQSLLGSCVFLLSQRKTACQMFASFLIFPFSFTIYILSSFHITTSQSTSSTTLLFYFDVFGLPIVPFTPSLFSSFRPSSPSFIIPLPHSCRLKPKRKRFNDTVAVMYVFFNKVMLRNKQRSRLSSPVIGRY